MKNSLNFGKALKIVLIALTVLTLCVAMVACDDTPKTVTLTFVADGVPDISPITAAAGSTITPPADPQKEDFDFEGWYDNEDFEGDKVTLPTVMPNSDKTYYAHFVAKTPEDDPNVRKVIYEKNNPLVTSTVAITPSEGSEGDTVRVKDGNDFNAQGYMFVGWSTQRGGLVSRYGEKFDGQYLAGDEITLGTTNITLYAQWAIEITTDEPVDGEKLYFYYDYVDHGNGGIFRVREVAGQDAPDVKLGFVSSVAEEDVDYYVFTFYEDGGDIEGRIFNDWTYVVRDDSYGTFIAYDYVEKGYYEYILTTDGYDFAVITTLVGIQTKVEYFGLYAFDKQYNDFVFNGYDESNAEVEFRFALDKCDVVIENASGQLASTKFDGKFIWQGLESGAFLLYDNGTLSNYRLELNGYGIARLLEFDEATEQTNLVAMGEYSGTVNYEEYYGEWHFAPVSGSASQFEFILNAVSDALGNTVPVYIRYNEEYAVTLNGENGSTFMLDGYGSALYTATGGVEYGGNVTIGETLVTFVPYIDDGNGNYVAGSTMYFNVNWEDKTFVVDTTEFVIDGTTLTDYTGSSQIAVIPDGVTAIANDVFNGKDLVSVTIPASVTSIGARAFQNNNTLMRAVFLANEPIAIDWASANDPFRWPAGSFIIVVPEGRQDAYRAAWGTACKYDIKGSVEVTELPEFEVDGHGVLIRYNRQDDSEFIDIVIPDEITEIADSVFKGLAALRSVDLNNVTKIGDGAFEFCENLKTVNFANVRIIEDGAFNGCLNLGNVDGEGKGVISLPSVVTIGDNAFQSCSELSYVILGENLTSIGDMAFRDISIYDEDDTLFVELLGDDVPQMGEKVFIGNIVQRIKVKNMDVAIKCFTDGGFQAYARHLYVESGSEKGTYFDGTNTLVIDGRAELMGSIVMWYVIDGESITFHTFDGDGNYMTIDGTYIDGVISFTLTIVDEGQVDRRTYNFSKADGPKTYASEDEVFTLVVDPSDLQPDKYEDYSGEADATLNGTPVKVSVQGYSTRILGYTHSDGVKYDITFTLEGNKLVISQMVRSTQNILNIAAPDGSVMNVRINASAIYVFGTLKIKVGEDAKGNDIMLPEFSDTMAQNPSENVYVFTREYNLRDSEGVYHRTTYQITMTVSEDGSTFTYEYREITA